MIFTKTHTADKRGTSTYTCEEAGLTLYVPKSVAVHPDQISVDGLAASPAKAPKAKLTDEEKKARAAAAKAERDAMTPAQRAQKKLDEANDRLAKAREAAAKAGVVAA